MIAEPAIFTCSICGEPSTDICAYCTKDACANHRCTRCKRCSDCCECEIPLSAEEIPAEPEPEASVEVVADTVFPLPSAPIFKTEPDAPGQAAFGTDFATREDSDPVDPPPGSENQS